MPICRVELRDHTHGLSGHWWSKGIGPIYRMRSRWSGKCALRGFCPDRAWRGVCDCTLYQFPHTSLNTPQTIVQSEATFIIRAAKVTTNRKLRQVLRDAHERNGPIFDPVAELYPRFHHFGGPSSRKPGRKQKSFNKLPKFSEKFEKRKSKIVPRIEYIMRNGSWKTGKGKRCPIGRVARGGEGGGLSLLLRGQRQIFIGNIKEDRQTFRRRSKPGPL
jgi:hypothetical protein